ncbi:MAG: protein TolR, partial [Burkholderiaceae bacterium]|nr:protein TolR [Burkholderiaceae bacterium]
MASRSSFRSSRRKAIADINVVPYIDVMLVLLVIFMVTAPLVNPGVVNLPTVGGAKVQALPPVFITIGADEAITIRKEGESAQTISKLELGAFARS